MLMKEMAETLWMQRQVRTPYFHHDLSNSSFNSLVKENDSRTLIEDRIIEKVSNKTNVLTHDTSWISSISASVRRLFVIKAHIDAENMNTNFSLIRLWSDTSVDVMCTSCY